MCVTGKIQSSSAICLGGVPAHPAGEQKANSVLIAETQRLEQVRVTKGNAEHKHKNLNSWRILITSIY